MPNDEDLIRDPRMQAFVREITSNVGVSISDMLTQALHRMEQNLSPAGRIVEVIRRDATGRKEKRQTTTPQLLAELNDNIQDLVVELNEANALVHKQMQMAGRRNRD